MPQLATPYAPRTPAHDRLEGRRLCVRRNETSPYERWRGSDTTLSEISRDPYVNIEVNTLSDALAEVAKLYNQDGALIWLDAGQRIRVLPAVLPQIIFRHIATERLANNGDGWVVEYISLVVDERTLRCLLMPDRRSGGLLERVPRV